MGWIYWLYCRPLKDRVVSFYCYGWLKTNYGFILNKIPVENKYDILEESPRVFGDLISEKIPWVYQWYFLKFENLLENDARRSLALYQVE
jgi:hypothetical protein